MARRRLTALLYLTDIDWTADEDGGCLRVHGPWPGGARDGTPRRGRIVLFDARRVWHEVKPAWTDRGRRSITIWVDAAAEPPAEGTAAPPLQKRPAPVLDKE